MIRAKIGAGLVVYKRVICIQIGSKTRKFIKQPTCKIGISLGRSDTWIFNNRERVSLKPGVLYNVASGQSVNVALVV